MQGNCIFQRNWDIDWKIDKRWLKKSFIGKTQPDFALPYYTLWLCSDPKSRRRNIRNQTELDPELRDKLQKKFGTLTVFDWGPWIKYLQNKFEKYDSPSPNSWYLQTEVLYIINSAKEKSSPHMGCWSYFRLRCACITIATWLITN